jgi:hypothetical protein
VTKGKLYEDFVNSANKQEGYAVGLDRILHEAKIEFPHLGISIDSRNGEVVSNILDSLKEVEAWFTKWYGDE